MTDKQQAKAPAAEAADDKIDAVKLEKQYRDNDNTVPAGYTRRLVTRQGETLPVYEKIERS